MRTRFLNTDYFFSAQSLFETLKNFNIISVSPPPPLSPRNPSLDLDLPFSDLESDLNAEIDRFPFATAFSDFLADVIPQFVSTEIEIEKNNGESSRSGVSEVEILWIPKIVLDSPYEEETKVAEESEWEKKLQFEILEVEFPLRKYASSCDEDETSVCFEVPCIKIPLDTVDIEMGVTVTYPYEVVKSICAVEVIPDCLSGKNESSSPDKISERPIVVPEFEVNEIGLGLEGTPSIEEAFTSLLPCVEPQHGAHGDELVVNAKEFLGSTNLDILEQFSVSASSEQGLMDEPVTLNSVIDMNVINLNGSVVLEENSAIHPMTSAVDCSSVRCLVYFQEVQILDIPSVDMLEQFSSSQAAMEPDISDKMLKDDIDSAGSLYESVVSYELALVDDTFKSLPVPILSDDKDMKLHSRIFGDMLHIFKPQALTASDGLYLDWHPLLEGTCTREICSTYIRMLHEVTCYYIESEMQPNDEEILRINLDFVDDSLERLNMLECKKVLSEIHGVTPQASDTSVKPVRPQILKDDVNNTWDEKEMPKVNSEKVSSLFESMLQPKVNSGKVSSLFESMSQSNDLNFFLDARRGTARKSCSSETKEGGSAKITPPAAFLKEPSQPSSLPVEYFQQWDIVVHQVSLSDHILGLIDNLQKSYLAILNYGTDLRSNTLLETENDLEFISLSKEKLLELIAEKSKIQFTSGCMDETFMGLLALYAIKQLAYLLCFFGIYTAHLYISNLTRRIDNLVIRLRPLESLIEDACWKSERDLIQSHPSLSLIEDFLKSNTSPNGKILIVAERLFWLTLNQKLTNMRIKTHEVRHGPNQLDALNNGISTNYILEALLHSECLLISHENVSGSFPFNKFSVILEYGGLCASSKISSITPKLHAPRIHFLNVNMENHSLHKALCEGFDVPYHLTLEGVSQSMPNLQEILNKEQIEELLSFVPIEKSNCFSSESGNHIYASRENESSTNMSHSLHSKNISPRKPSSPDIVIVVNTQNFEKKMIISRRSSYQKVLALEKEGAQVVERDINLPLDLIFSAAVCLVWYETRNVGDNMTSTSSMPIFMETIATNVLMTLSFAFSGCILIFEGETSFLSAIMESSDTLYAAAVSLDLNLQLFCSYMPESTDAIILSCIQSSSKSNRGISRTMTETETLGESFLTRFPSINPLSAHAILSSGGTLIEFLEWSQKRRIQAIGKYHVPDESIYLFDTLCKYGEIGESKSVMTECSSIDSDISSGKLRSDRKRQKYAVGCHNLDTPVDDSFSVKPLSQTKERITEVLQPSQPHQLKDFFHLQDMKKVKSSQLIKNDEVLAEKGGPYVPSVSNLDSNRRVGCMHSKGNFSDEVIDHNSNILDGTDEVLAKRRGTYTSMISDLDSKKTVDYEHLMENFGNEVVDYNSTFLDENHPSVLRTINLFGRSEPRSEPVVKSYLHGSRPAFNLSSHRTFPTSEEINSDTHSWTSVMDRSLSLEEKILGRKASRSSKNDSPMKHQREYLEGNFVPRCARNALGLLSEENTPFYVEKPHSKAAQSSKMLHGLQRTFEFLRSAKDKKEGHQKTLTCNTCTSCPGSSINMGKSYKIRSPSIIDSYKYRGGRQIPENIKKWRKGGRVRDSCNNRDSSNNKERKESSFIIPPTWTPVDKRARQNLSFTRTGNEKQSKLVWTNIYSPGSSCILRKRSRDAV